MAIYKQKNGDSTQKELEAFREIYQAILRGNKPTLNVPTLIPYDAGPGSDETNNTPPDAQYSVHQRAFHLLRHMEAQDCLSEQPGTYVRLHIQNPGRGQPHTFGTSISTGGTPVCPERITKYHPFSNAVIEEIVKIRSSVPFTTRETIEILGEGYTTHQTEEHIPVDYPNTSALIVPSRGNVAMALTLVHILLDKHLGHRHALQTQLIFIESRGIGFWKPILAAFGNDLIDWLEYELHGNMHFDQSLQPVMESLGIHAVQSLDDVDPLLDKLLPITPDRRSEAHDFSMLAPQASILLATKTRDKIYELRKQFDGTNIRIWPLDVISNFKNPREISGTYAANAKEKMDEAHAALSKTIAERGVEDFRRALQRRNINPDNLYIMAEDSGLHLSDARILEAMDLAKLGLKEGYVFNSRHFPGVEFGPAINSALGEKEFWEEVIRVNRTLDNHEPRPEAFSTSVLALSKVSMAETKKGNALTFGDILFFSSVTNDVISESARPETNVPTSFHYQIPMGTIPLWVEGAQDHKTRAELPSEEWFKISPRGLAAKTIMLANHMLDDHGDLHPDYSTQTNPRIVSPPDAPYHMGVFGEPDGDFRISSRYVTHPLHYSNLGTDALNLWHHSLNELARNADAFVLAPEPKATNRRKVLFAELFCFFSAIVARQLHPRDIDKPFVVYNKDGYWDRMLSLYDHMRNNAMIFDQSRLLIKEVSTPKELHYQMQKGYIHRFRSTHREAESTPIRTLDSGRYNVAVFCSATARNDLLNSDALHLGRFLGTENFGLVYGAGDREMMGSVYTGMLQIRNASRGAKGWISASSCDHMLEVEADHPEVFKTALSGSNKNGVNHYYDAATIYDRIAYMITAADAFAVIPGGAGTLQELAAILMLKQARNKIVEGKPIVILSKLRFKDSEVDFYGPLLEWISPKTLETMNVTVVDTMEELQQQLLLFRAEH